jgi:BolA protein
MGDSERVAMIQTRLERALAPVRLEIIDQSLEHAGHPGAARGGGHFQVTVISDRFRGLTPLERHRLVYAALADLMSREIHALSIQALTPDEPPG